MNRIDITIDNSEFYDFELVSEIIEYNLDVDLDYSEFYDFILTDDNINYDDITFLNPACENCNDNLSSLNVGYGKLQYDNRIFATTDDNNTILYH